MTGMAWGATNRPLVRYVPCVTFCACHRSSDICIRTYKIKIKGDEEKAKS